MEELINFKIKTVGDKLIEEGSDIAHPISIRKGLTGLRAIAVPLLTSKEFPATGKAKKYKELIADHEFRSKLGEEDSIMQESSMPVEEGTAIDGSKE